jgi:hypothetical protein
MKEIRFIRKFSTAAVALACSLAFGAATAAGEGTPSAPEASPDVYKVLAENDQFRVIEATWQPGQEDNFHSHPADRVAIFQTDCRLRLSKPDGSYRDASPKAGKARAISGKPVKSHKAKNIGDDVCIILLVERK